MKLTAPQAEILRRAREASKNGNHDYTISLLMNLVVEVPQHIEARRLLRASEMIKARNMSGFAKAAAAGKILPLVMKGKGALKKNPAEALALAEEALKVDPYNAQANALLAEAGEAMGLPLVPVLAFETLREAKPDDVENLKQLGFAYMKAGDAERAQQAFQKALSLRPNDGEANKGLKDASALFASKAGRWDEGKDFRDSLKDKEEARALEQQNKAVNTVEAIDEQIRDVYAQWEQQQNNLQLTKKIADLYKRRNDLDSALQWYEYAYGLANQADPNLERAISDIRLAQFDQPIEARKAELLAAGADPDQDEHLRELIRQRAALSLEIARNRVAKYPNDLNLRFELGEALYQNGLAKEAVPELQQALRQPNVRHRACNLLGLCYRSRNMFDLAAKQFATAAEEIPVMDALKKEVVYNLGLTLEDMGRHEEALTEFKKIYEVDYQFRDVAERVERSYQVS